MPKFTPNKAAGRSKAFTLDPEVAVFELLNNWWIIVIGVLISAMISYVVVTETYKAEYTSSATFVVTTKGSVSSTVFSNLNTARGLAESFKYVLDSDVLMEKICETLNIDSFPGTVNAALLPDTNILSLTVTSNSPSLTFRMINAIIDNHHIVSDSVIANASMDLLMRPTVPKAPAYGMGRAGIIKKTMLFTAIALIACTILYSAMSDKVKNVNDLNDRIDCDRLATFYHERSKRTMRSLIKHRKKQDLLVNNPTTSFGYSETFRLFRTRIEYLMEKGGHKVLMIGSVQENEGRSTIAANIALMLAYNNKKVLLIEGDMFEPVLEKRLGMYIGAEFSLNEYLLKPAPINLLPKVDGIPNLSLLACKNTVPNSSEIIGSDSMQDFMKQARKYFDYIIMDTPPIAYSGDAESLAELSDAAIMVIRQNMAAARRINDAIEVLENSDIDVLGCVFNDVKRISIFDSAVNAVRGGYGSYMGSGYGGRRHYSGHEHGYGYGYGYGYEKNGGSHEERGNMFRPAESEKDEVND